MGAREQLQIRRLLAVSFFFLCLIILTQPLLAHAAEKLTLGVHPYLPPRDIYDRFLPLAEYLQRETGMDIEISISKSYEDHINRIGHGELDIAFIGPASYVLMVEKYGERPLLAVLQVGASHTFRGVIIKRVDSRIRTLADLTGKRFAFGDPNSTMSHLVPRYMLWREGVDISNLGSYEFLSDHVNIALGVLTGVFDAGAVKMEVFEEYKDKGLEALAYSPEIAEHVFVASSRLSQEEVGVLRTALLTLHEKEGGKEVLSSIKKDITALVPATWQEYESLGNIIATLKELGVEP